jgi:quinol monooxygenase YgiN
MSFANGRTAQGFVGEENGVVMVGLILLVRTQAGQRQELLQAMHMFFDAFESEACQGRCLFEETENPNRFLIMENWKDQASLDDYLDAEPFKALLGAIDVLGNLEDMQLLEFKTDRARKMV